MNRKIKVFTLLIIVCLLVSSCGRMISTSMNTLGKQIYEETTFPLSLSVQGNSIVDESGRTIVLKGLCPTDPVWHAYGNDYSNIPWGENHYAMMKQWGATVVRLAIHPGVWQYERDAKTFAAMDQAISWAHKYGMYVIIDFHSIGFPPTGVYNSQSSAPYGAIYATTPVEITDFWTKVAQRYASNKTVAFYEIFNEPDVASNSTNWLLWKGFVDSLKTTIRTYDANKIILVSGLDWSYDLSQAVANPITGNNIAYSVHPYPGKNIAKSWDLAFGNLQATYPVVVTEFGFTPGAGSEVYYEDQYQKSLTENYRDAIMSYLDAKKMGWVAWCFNKTWDPTLISDEYYTPTVAGAFFKQKLSQ